jgi:uncharacterized membrane protein YbhN (UPF0104 family)
VGHDGAELSQGRGSIVAFGISLSFLAVALVIAAGAIGTAIPASPGYVGTYEFVLVNLLTIVGILAPPATAFAVEIHAITWLTLNIVDTICALRLGVRLGSTAHGRVIIPEA